MDEMGFFLFMEEQERKEKEQQEEKDDTYSLQFLKQTKS